jgi:1,4-dihydroxy-2-naphthoate octaprenyltransferase
MAGRVDLLGVVRFPILLGGALGCALGALLGLASGGVFNPLLFVVCYGVVAFGDLSTHFSNDYFDVGLDRVAPRKTFGGSNLLVARADLMSSALDVAKTLSLVSIALAVLAAAMGVSLVIIPLVLAANALGWLYSLPPIRLAYRGLGEAAIAVGTGFGVPAAGYLAVKGALDTGFVLVSLALVLYGFVLGVSLELPDVEADRAGGKMNLVVRFGWRACLRVALLLCLASTVILSLFSGRVMAIASIIPLVAVLLGNLFASDKFSRLDAIASSCILSLFAFLVASVGSLLL